MTLFKSELRFYSKRKFLKKWYLLFLVISLIIFIGCNSRNAYQEKSLQIHQYLQLGEFDKANSLIEDLKSANYYKRKDRVLYYLDKGAVQHFAGNYQESSNWFEKSDRTMEDLYTKSISRAALSMLLNDNSLTYSGEIYEDIYANIFNSLNYLHQDNFNDAYVEIKRVNDKLNLLDDKYGKWVDLLNSADTMGIKIDKPSNNFYDDVLAHYLSALIFEADGEYDNARISVDNMRQAWQLSPNIYQGNFPEELFPDTALSTQYLNIISFTGRSPLKKEIGGEITTYENAIQISGVNNFRKNLIIPIKGIKEGYHFKFSFPSLANGSENISDISVYFDTDFMGKLVLIEPMDKIAEATFNAKKYIVYMKSIIRSVGKGLASAKAKKRLRKKMDAEKSIWGTLLNIGVDAVVDATENPDLRCWKTLPASCYSGRFPLPENKTVIRLEFKDRNGFIVKTEEIQNFEQKPKLNLIELSYLN